MERIAIVLLSGLLTLSACGQSVTTGTLPDEQPARQEMQPASPTPATQIPASRLMQKRLPEVSFDDAPLGDALQRLAKIAGTNIVVRWPLLAQVGVQRSTPITLHARNLRLSQLIWLLLDEAATTDAKLAYRAERDTILISTLEEFQEVMVVQAYPVQDLIASRLLTPTIAVGRVRDAVVGVVPSVAAGAVAVRPVIGHLGSGVYLGGDEWDYLHGDEVDATSEQHMQKLIELIVTTIEPDSWAVNGGAGTITSYRGMLVVRNNPLVHQQIGGLLAERQIP